MPRTLLPVLGSDYRTAQEVLEMYRDRDGGMKPSLRGFTMKMPRQKSISVNGARKNHVVYHAGKSDGSLDWKWQVALTMEQYEKLGTKNYLTGTDLLPLYEPKRPLLPSGLPSSA